MKQYFIYVKNEQLGPFNFEELKAQKISKETKVWFEGLEDWKNADEIEELKSILVSIPPPINSFTSQPPPPKFENNQKTGNKFEEEEPTKILGLKKNIFYSILGALVIIIGLTYFNNLQDKNREILQEQNRQTESYNQQQKELEEQNARLAEQEKIEANRIAREKKEALEKRINEIVEQLNVNYQNLEIAKQKLNNVSAFKLLRTSSERNEQINSVQNDIDIIKDEIRNLEAEMQKINPNWGSGR